MIDVLLSAEEVGAAYAAAKAVNRHKADIGNPGTDAVYGVDPFESRFTSFLAEEAVNKLLGLPSLAWAIHDGGDGKIDIRHPDGCTIQVKYRRERERDLATGGMDFHEELKADAYVLVWPVTDQQDVLYRHAMIQPVTLTIVGWCTREEFLTRIVNRGPVRMRGKKWEMKWSQLRDPQVLKAWADSHVEEARQPRLRYVLTPRPAA